MLAVLTFSEPFHRPGALQLDAAVFRGQSLEEQVEGDSCADRAHGDPANWPDLYTDQRGMPLCLSPVWYGTHHSGLGLLLGTEAKRQDRLK